MPPRLVLPIRQATSRSVVFRYSTSVPRPPRRRKGSKPIEGSLFEQLFPAGSSRAVVQEEEPCASLGSEGWLGGVVEQDAELQDKVPGPEKPTLWPDVEAREEAGEQVGGADGETQAMIVLKNGNKNTLPSDFYRVVNKGARLEGGGWSMMRVIQARRRNTMEPLPTYFLLFPSVNAAVAYKHEVERLGKLKSTDADRQARLTISPPTRSTMWMDVVYPESAIRGRMESMGQGDIFRRDQDKSCLVVIKVEGYQLSLKSLGQLIDRDGVNRNLYWKLNSSWGVGGIAKSVDGHVPELLRSESMEAGGRAFINPMEGGITKDGAPEKDPMDVFSSRFFLSFQDIQEARRFVRQWHKRTVHFKKSHVSVINATLIS